MKKEQELKELKEVIKSAILEAFAEMYGVATTEDTETIPEEDGGDTEDKESGKGGSSAENSGGGLNNGRPKPNVGVGTLNLEKPNMYK